MSSNLVVCKNYIVKPFTIDEEKTRLREDGYSVSIEEGGFPSFNIHVPAIGLEYLERDCSRETVKKERRSLNLQKYIGYENISKYSLDNGERRVLTMKIHRNNMGYISVEILCESIEVCNNYSYNQDIDNETEVIKIIADLFKEFEYEGSSSLVKFFTLLYSVMLSSYLIRERVKFFAISADYNRGRFTAPIRRIDSFYNQIILLNHMKKILRDDYSRFFVPKDEIVQNMPKTLYLK